MADEGDVVSGAGAPLSPAGPANLLTPPVGVSVPQQVGPDVPAVLTSPVSAIRPVLLEVADSDVRQVPAGARAWLVVTVHAYVSVN